MNIRPHHLLCIRKFEGKGYSREFVENMTGVIDRIVNKNEIINVVLHTDSICLKCPYKIGENVCKSQAKVESLDASAMKALGLITGVYSCEDINKRIESNLTEDVFKTICKDCSWYGMCHLNENKYKDILKLKFDESFSIKKNSFNPQYAEQIVDFFEKHKNSKTFVCHCEAGVSRSPAVAKAWGIFKKNNEMVKCIDKVSGPHKLVLKLLKDEMQKRDKIRHSLKNL